jgi:hypothetical protein
MTASIESIDERVNRAFDNIEIGHGDCSAVFRCKECGETAGLVAWIQHSTDCHTGYVLKNAPAYRVR